jgi:membrane dipeptidase
VTVTDAMTPPAGANSPAGASLRAAKAILATAGVFDGHNDLPWALRQAGETPATPIDVAEPLSFTHTDLPRLVAGGVGAQFWSVWVPAELDGDSAVRKGGHSIAGSLGVLRAMHALGVRYMTLTHNRNVSWADSATDEPAVGGLSDFGREVVAEMQRIGMLVDLSHVSAATMNNTLDVATAPVIFSHSSAWALTDHPRNVPDAVLERLAANGGVAMVTFVPTFVSAACREWELGAQAEAKRRGLDYRDLASRKALADWAAAHPMPSATVGDVADHVDHVRAVAGIDHVGLGGDYDGTGELPAGLSDVSGYPTLFAELLDRGWSEPDCEKLASGNALRVVRDAQDAATASAEPTSLVSVS